LVLSALALASCDEGTNLNVDLPNTSVISTEYTDLEVDAATVNIVPVYTLKTDHYLVGRMSDNIAGNIQSSAYLNLITGSSNDSLPSKMTTPVLDSVVVVAGFDKVYGSTSAPIRLDVSTLQAPLDEREPYNSRSTVPLGTTLGTNISSRLDRTLRVKTDSTATSPAYFTTVPDQTVRLVLQRTAPAAAPFGVAPAVSSAFISNTLFGALRTNSRFTQGQLDGLLKGLALQPTSGYSGSVINLTRGFNGRMAFYFHDDALPPPTAPLLRKWHSYSFFFGPVFSTSGAASSRDPRYFTAISNNFTGTPLAQLADVTQAVPSTALGGLSYLQEGVGIGTRVTFRTQDINMLRNIKGITINRAELRVPVKPFSTVLFPNPSQVFAVEVDANNQVLQRTINFQPNDRTVQADGANPLGSNNPSFATLQDGTSTQPYYSLLMTSYLQAYLTDKLESRPAALVVVPNIRSSTGLSLNRATVDATGIRLRVYYSKQ